MNQLNNIIGANIKQFRKAVKMSTTRLAELSDTSQSTISKIENGSSTNIEILIKICDALKVSLYDILPAGSLPSSESDHSGKRQLLGVLDELTDAEIKTIQTLLTLNILPIIKQITPLITALDELDEKSRDNLQNIFYSILNNRL